MTACVISSTVGIFHATKSILISQSINKEHLRVSYSVRKINYLGPSI